MRSEVNEEFTSGSVEFKDENYKGDAIFNLTPEIAMYSPFSVNSNHVPGQIVLSSSVHLSKRKQTEIILVAWPSASSHKAF